MTPSAVRYHRAGFILGVLAGLGALVAAYSNHFENAFHFDDSHCIENNLAIRSLGNVGAFFSDPHTYTSRPENAAYRPVLTLSFALDYFIAGGLEPRQFHLTQFGSLLLLGVLVFFLFRHLTDLAQPSPWNPHVALFAATLFCLHTANTETVNYLSSRSSLFGTLGAVAALLLWTGWPRGRKSGLYLVPMVAGGLAKPISIMFAPILCAYVFLFEERGSLVELCRSSGRRKALRALWRSGPALGVGSLLFAFVSRMNADTLLYARTSRWDYLITQPFVWLHYFRLFLLPRGLTADTDWVPLAHWRDGRLLAGLLFLGALAASIVWLSTSRRLAPAAFGLAWFVLALLPSSSVFPLSEVYNEHRIFFPYVGLTLAVVWCAALALRALAAGSPRLSRAALPAALVLGSTVLAAHALGTHARNEVWATSETLWRDVAHKSPRNGRGLMNYGLALMARGRLEEALDHFERARVLTPDYAILEINLGIVKGALGRLAESEQHFQRALALEPGYAAGRYFYARWLIERGRAAEALEQLETALRQSPGDADARSLLMRLCAAIGDTARLREVAAGTLALAPADASAQAYASGALPFPVEEDSAQAYRALGLQMTQRENWLDAAAVYRQALARDQASAEGWNNLGWALLQLGYADLAVPCFRRAAELDPAMDVARGNLDRALQRAAEAQGRP